MRSYLKAKRTKYQQKQKQQQQRPTVEHSYLSLKYFSSLMCEQVHTGLVLSLRHQGLTVLWELLESILRGAGLLPQRLI